MKLITQQYQWRDNKMDKNAFFELCKKEFEYLFNEYNFKVFKKEKESWGYKIYLNNSTTGIPKFNLKRNVYFVFLQICKLIDGEFAEHEGEIRPESKLNNFYYEDLLSIRSPESKFPRYTNDTKLNDELINKLVKHHADKLKKYAVDILKGDFAIFAELDKIVKVRAKKGAFQKWGKDAEKYGWVAE
jgi:hypothetical protein